MKSPHKLHQSVWITAQGHRKLAAINWLDNVVELENLQRTPPESATLHLLGCEVLLRPDGTYLISDTSGG
jgi:hypothetical protein